MARIEMVESLAESGISRAPGVSLISRRHLEKLLAEQGLAYNNIVNDRARLGRLAGAHVLLMVSIGNTPITTDVEEGVRDVSLRKGARTLWSNSVQILKEAWLTPDLRD